MCYLPHRGRCGSHDADGAGPGAGDTDWTGRTVRGRDGSRLGRLVEVRPGRRRLHPGRLGCRPVDVRQAPAGAARRRGGRRPQRPDGVAADRASVRTAPALVGGTADPAEPGTLRQHYTGRGVLADARALQHERYGGAKLGSAFFGWLVAVGLTVLLGVLGGRRDRRPSAGGPPLAASSPSPCCSSPTTRAGTSPVGWPASTAPATASCRGWSVCVATHRSHGDRRVRRRAVRRAQQGLAADPAREPRRRDRHRADPRRHRRARHAARRRARWEGRRELPPPRRPRGRRRALTIPPLRTARPPRLGRSHVTARPVPRGVSCRVAGRPPAMTSCTAIVSSSGIIALSDRPASRHSVTSTSSW